MNTWFTSDWHFNHDKEFVVQQRGFSSVQDMNSALIERHNMLVKPNDIVYFLGDAFFGANQVEGVELLKKLNGYFYMIKGNHDTYNKLKLINNLPNWQICGHATVIEQNGLRFYLSHYPTLTASPKETKKLKSRTICLHGHTHQATNFYDDTNPYIYHVGVDSHQCEPVLLEMLISDINEKM